MSPSQIAEVTDFSRWERLVTKLKGSEAFKATPRGLFTFKEKETEGRHISAQEYVHAQRFLRQQEHAVTHHWLLLLHCVLAWSWKKTNFSANLVTRIKSDSIMMWQHNVCISCDHTATVAFSVNAPLLLHLFWWLTVVRFFVSSICYSGTHPIYLLRLQVNCYI